MTCIIVTGVPRSGQALMMQILHSVGIYIGEEDDIEKTPDAVDPAGLWWHKKLAGIVRGIARYDDKRFALLSELVGEFKAKAKMYAFKIPMLDEAILRTIVEKDSVKAILCYRDFGKIIKRTVEYLQHEAGIHANVSEQDILMKYYAIVKTLKKYGVDYIEVDTENINAQELAEFLSVDVDLVRDAINKVVRREWL